MAFFKRRPKKYCPICNKESRFRKYGVKARSDAMCPKCKSLERHRLVYLYIKNETNLLSDEIFHDKIRLLHIAPEPALSDAFSQNPNIEYLSADINPNKAMIEMDVEKIPYRDGFFDIIYCSHVLEHVNDDCRALSELCRVLDSDGWAIIQVPLRHNSEETLEDPEINTPELRKKYYGQEDHLRYYGLRDFRKRLENAGFDVEVIDYFQTFDSSTIEKYSLLKQDLIFQCFIRK